MSLINWSAACLPNAFGGLGITDLRSQNIALLLRWWWKAYDDPNCLWAEFLIKIRGKGPRENHPRLWLKSGSFFWKQLQGLRGFFNWSTAWQIGDGKSISFWFDSWDGLPKEQHQHIQGNQSISLTDAYSTGTAQLLMDTDLSPLLFTGEEDFIHWRWESTGVYTSRSTYRILTQGGKI